MYEFASGVINVWEKHLLSKLDQERMLKAPNRESAFLVLFDTDLGNVISPQIQNNIEEILRQDLLALKQRLEGVLDDNGFLLSFLFLQFDAWNLKGILKSIFFAEKAKEFQSFVFSLQSYENLNDYVRTALGLQAKKILSEQKSLHYYVAKMTDEALQKSKELFGGQAVVSAQAIEKVVDEAYFHTKSAMAKKSPSLLELVKLEIDIANLRSVLGGSGAPDFLPGGNLTKAHIEHLMKTHKGGETEKGIKEFLETLQLSFFIEHLRHEHALIVLDKQLDGYIAQRFFQLSQEKGSGAEKVVAFFQKKINTHANIRLILFAKENQLDSAHIEKILLPI